MKSSRGIGRTAVQLTRCSRIWRNEQASIPGSTVVVDRGMAFEENLEQIRAHGLHYLVAGRQSERNEWLDDFEKEADWEEVIRVPSPRNPLQKKTRVGIKRRQKGDEVYILSLE